MKKNYSTYRLLIILSFAALALIACSQDNAAQEKNAQTSSTAMSSNTQPLSNSTAVAKPTNSTEKQQSSQGIPGEAKDVQEQKLDSRQNGTSDKGDDSMKMGGNATTSVDSTENISLLHRRFLLLTVNGVSFAEKEKRPSLEFNEGFRISGGICNRFTGMAEFANGMLTAKQLASTKMFCTDQDLNELETNFALLLEKGASLNFDGQKLTLSGTAGDKQLELVYELRDLVQ
jgi:Heat shock protein